MKKTDSKRKRQARETRERILSAAIALVEEKGIDGFTVDDIQERTGCSRGLFYNYFQGLNDIVSEIVGVTENQYISIRDELLSGTRDILGGLQTLQKPCASLFSGIPVRSCMPLSSSLPT